MVSLKDVQVASPGPDIAVVSFTGEHDLATCSSVSELLDSLLDTNDLVVADFSGAEFIDSSTLNVVIAAHKLAAARGKSFRLQLGTEAIVERVFQISGVLEHISWAPSREEALNGTGNGIRDLASGSDEAAA